MNKFVAYTVKVAAEINAEKTDVRHHKINYRCNDFFWRGGCMKITEHVQIAVLLQS